MEISWDELTVNFETIKEDIFSDWHWLIGPSAQPAIITTLGDAFLQEKSGEVYWLNLTDSLYEKVAKDSVQFQEAMVKNVDDWFVPELVAELLNNGKSLETNQCFGFIKPTVLGGEYEPENFTASDISVYFSVQGQIHEQVKDLPDGATINQIKFREN